MRHLAAAALTAVTLASCTVYETESTVTVEPPEAEVTAGGAEWETTDPTCEERGD